MAGGSLLFDSGGCYDSRQLIGVSFAHRCPKIFGRCNALASGSSQSVCNDRKSRVVVASCSLLFVEVHCVIIIRDHSLARTYVRTYVRGGLSLEFRSGEICSRGTKFSLKILVPRNLFSENFVPLKKLFHS